MRPAKSWIRSYARKMKAMVNRMRSHLSYMPCDRGLCPPLLEWGPFEVVPFVDDFLPYPWDQVLSMRRVWMYLLRIIMRNTQPPKQLRATGLPCQFVCLQ